MEFPNPSTPISSIRDHVRRHILALPGSPRPTGIELVTLIHLLANLYHGLQELPAGDTTLTGPRFGLLMHLYVLEQEGVEPDGVTPTFLSRCQNVSKNTVSALLRGLEDQGLIQRSLDAQDRRAFRIQLSNAGRELVRSHTQHRVDWLNHLASDLSEEEQQSLLRLLERLYFSIQRRTQAGEANDRFAPTA